MTRREFDYRLDQAAERSATIFVAFCRLATAFHSTHAGTGMWLTCNNPTCRANASNLRRWRDDEPEPVWTMRTGEISH